MYKLLIETTEGYRCIHALRFAELRILHADEVFVVERRHCGEWLLGFKCQSSVSWRLFIDDGAELLEGRWSPLSDGNGDEGGQG